MKNKLLSEEELAWSPIVANNSMNRERIAFGVNSYEKDIGLNLIRFLLDRKERDYIQWTDLCCGSGNALIQASTYFENRKCLPEIALIGIDLVDYFSPHKTNKILKLKSQNITQWLPERDSDLITIVHGLHYIGDKIGAIIKAASFLKKDGLLIANIDFDNIKIEGYNNAKNIVTEFLKSNDIHYSSRKKNIKIEGKKVIYSRFKYLGADDKVGSNYTGQPVVDSVYSII